jgi:AraC-like DNA-binding protein
MESNLELPLPLSELSRRLGWSPTYFNRKFRAEVGTPPANYYLRRRIAEACRRLHADGRAITEIGLELGFGSSQYFATAFKRTMGITPQAFRRKPARPVKVSD